MANDEQAFFVDDELVERLIGSEGRRACPAIDGLSLIPPPATPQAPGG